MSIVFRRTCTKQELSESVSFSVDSEDFITYVTDTFVSTGKCTAWRTIVSENEQTRVMESTWSTQQFVDEALQDLQLLEGIDAMSQYNNVNNITSTLDTIIY